MFVLVFTTNGYNSLHFQLIHTQYRMFNVSCIAVATELGLIKWVIKVKLLSFIVGKW